MSYVASQLEPTHPFLFFQHLLLLVLPFFRFKLSAQFQFFQPPAKVFEAICVARLGLQLSVRLLDFSAPQLPGSLVVLATSLTATLRLGQPKSLHPTPLTSCGVQIVPISPVACRKAWEQVHRKKYEHIWVHKATL